MRSQTMPRRRPPGVLAALPDSLTYYTYCDDDNGVRRYLHKSKRRGRIKRQNNNDDDSEQIITIEEFGCQTEFIPDKPLGLIRGDDDINKNGFTLFFFCDSNNRQSLNSIPIISKWCYYALNCGGSDINDGDELPPSLSDSRVICIPNQLSPHEINVHNNSNITDSITQTSINATATTGSATKGHVLSILKGTGFYHLPFLHKSRLPLLHLLGATRVPSVIVVSNATGRIVTRYGWEAIEREGGPGGLLERWIDSTFVANKKEDTNEEDCFESNIVNEWKLGRSGLPMWWHILSFIL